MPERIEDYEVLEVIGTGSFGTCYKVRKKNTQNIFVWKAVDYGSMSEERKKLLVSEVNVLRELKHPNIVRYYDRILHKESATLYIIMEWCQGGDLETLIKNCRRSNTFLEEAFIWRVLYQTSRALQACHGPGRPVLHRDIKPANLFLDSMFNIKLGDFGLARMLSATDVERDDADAYFAETVVGTPFYMSPEIVKGSKYNRKSDVWSLGCVIFELCSLSPPFFSKNLKALAQRIREGRFPRIPSCYSDELNSLIVFMLTVNQDVRPGIETILHHPSVVMHIAQWSLGKPVSLNYVIGGEGDKAAKTTCEKLLDETFCSCIDGCCGNEVLPEYAEIVDPDTNRENACTKKNAVKEKQTAKIPITLSNVTTNKCHHHTNMSKGPVHVSSDSKGAIKSNSKRSKETNSKDQREDLHVAERLDLLRQREAKLRMRELSLEEREHTVRRKEKEAALASRLARETMGRACVYLNSCRDGRSSVATTHVSLRSQSPSERTRSHLDADSSLDQEHGDTSVIAKTSAKLDPRNVSKPVWSTFRKVTFNLNRHPPQFLNEIPIDVSVVDNAKNSGMMGAVIDKEGSGSRLQSCSDSYYWLQSKRQIYREKNSDKENDVPNFNTLLKKATKKNVLLPSSNTFPNRPHSQIL